MINYRYAVPALSLLLACSPALAATYAVGIGAGCTHPSLQLALNAAASTPSGSAHLIKLPVGELLVANVSASAPLADIIIEGGYSNCTAASSTGITTLRKAASPASARILDFSNSANDAAVRRAIRLRSLTLTGASFTGALGGGAVFVSGKLDLHLQSRVRIHDNEATNGGGIYLVSLGTPANNTRLFVNGGDTPAQRPEITNNRAIGPGTNGNGGGIYAIGSVTITIRNGRFADNQARRNGGGIALAAGENAMLVFNNITALPIEISDNIAGTNGYSDTQGFGGGLYSESAMIHQLSEEQPIPQISINGNQANHGGGLYLAGRDDQRVPATFNSTSWVNNRALGKGGAIHIRNGVDLLLSHQQDGGYCLVVFVPFRCSRVVGNIAENQGTMNTPGGAALYMASAIGQIDAGTGIARIQRTQIEGNQDQSGQAAVAYAGANNRLEIEASVIRNNTASGANSTLIYSHGPHPVLARYNTILANSSNRLFFAESQTVSIIGSILWDPGKTLAFLQGGASFDHGSCLLSHTTDQLPPSTTIRTTSPRLDSRFRPRGSSPAIDGCDNAFSTPIADIDLNPRGYDVPGVDITWGANDLGAYEQRDIVFYGGFGSKPTN